VRQLHQPGKDCLIKLYTSYGKSQQGNFNEFENFIHMRNVMLRFLLFLYFYHSTLLRKEVRVKYGKSISIFFQSFRAKVFFLNEGYFTLVEYQSKEIMKKMILAIVSILTGIIVSAQTMNDTTAIRQLLEKESATWRTGDVAGHAACWYIQPYSKILVSTADGKCYDVPPQSMINPSRTMVGKGGSSTNSNYTFCIHGNNAWVSHDEKSIANDGNISYSHEIRILEKINGQWKLVAQSIHLYKP
jgi:hypothetical protein